VDLDLLARRVSQGDTTARAELCKQLGPTMLVLVQKTLRSSGFGSAMGRRILEEWQRLYPLASLADLTPYHTVEVARNLCRRFVDRLQADPHGGQHWRETLVA
jgi:hypothetical protein